MLVEAIPLANFVHGHINAVEGRPIVPWIEESTARDLERAGLVRIRTAHAVPVRRVEAGKAEDDGQGQPSSASPAAPALPTTTSESSKRGRGRPRKDTSPS